MEKNYINKDELEKKIKEIDLLMQKAKNSLYNMDNLINQTIDSKKGVWDGEEAKNFKDEYQKISKEIPGVLEIFEKQSNNIKLLIEKNKETQN